LLFDPEVAPPAILPLGDRRHLLLDDALFERTEHIAFRVQPPKRINRVMDGTVGQFRKHLAVVEDETGLIRLFNGGPDDYLMVHVSSDGLNFTAPDTGLHHRGRRNIVIAEPAPLGSPFIDPHAEPEHRWKYLSGLSGRGVYLYTSPDGWRWQRQRQAALSFRSGSQSSHFYDDQRGRYVSFHRTGLPRGPDGGTQREFVRAETADPYAPWPVPLLTTEEVLAAAKVESLRTPLPWWLDNGPLTPGDFGIELPRPFAPDPTMDPTGSGIYVPKAEKYPWAADAYVAFPALYFDYEQPQQPLTRRILFEDKSRRLGSGVVETQLAVSRDGITWRRLPSPTYVPLATHEGRKLHQIYLAQGMVRRGDELWQYFYGTEEYHSPVKRDAAGNGVYRAVQRLDAFVAAVAPYEREGLLVTKPLTFAGSRLELNINTGGMGYAQVGFLDEAGRLIPGFGVDECVLINGDHVRHIVEWLPGGTDVSSLAGKAVRLVVRLRGGAWYAFQFVE
jgi:hypothetical protein